MNVIMMGVVSIFVRCLRPKQSQCHYFSLSSDFTTWRIGSMVLIWVYKHKFKHITWILVFVLYFGFVYLLCQSHQLFITASHFYHSDNDIIPTTAFIICLPIICLWFYADLDSVLFPISIKNLLQHLTKHFLLNFQIILFDCCQCSFSHW